MEDESKKAHRPRKAGPNAKKSKSKDSKNAKAFAFNSSRRAEKAARRTLDLEQKRMHVPMVDRSGLEAPPIVVAVVGPPQVGKSTLIRSLVKRYTKHNIQEIKGPITVVAGKNRRITFIECNNDVNSMIDIAKIADLCLLLVDASFGFEMETFEFLNVLQTHGFPKIMGVLTHLDSFKDNKKLKKLKKEMKQRFWTEIYQGAKLFYLSGLINGKYMKNEILNLSRFISVMKFRPLQWRNQHPYMVADRMEDISNPEDIRSNPKVDRKVALYGYMRGTNLKPNMKVHIPGVGDHSISEISLLSDPCPTPQSMKTGEKKQRRSLNEKEKLLYAPMSDVSGILYDKDAVYINIPEKYYRGSLDDSGDENLKEDFTKGEKMLEKIYKTSTTIDDNLNEMSFDLFKNKGGERRKMEFADEIEVGDSSDESENEEDLEDEFHGFDDKVVEKGDEELQFADTDSELDEDNDHEDEENVSEISEVDENDVDGSDVDSRCDDSEDMHEKASKMYKDGRKRVNLMKLIYDYDNETKSEDTKKEEELFKKISNSLGDTSNIDNNDSARYISIDLSKYEDEEFLESLKAKFITGQLKKKEGEEGEEDENDENGDFEDLEAEIKESEDEEREEEKEEEDEESKLLRKKEELKAKFDEEYDSRGYKKIDEKEDPDVTYYDKMKQEMAEQQQINRNEFADLDDEARVQLEGFSSGMYVRIVLDQVPCELVENFSPYYPLIVGGLLSNEESFGFIQVRIKRHRWYKKVLKTNDPLVISMGWRRFQTLPVYSINTDGERNRMLKYTPEHMHCLATFYGPVTPQNTGLCAFQSVNQGVYNFRICATGVVLDMNQSTEIIKKLKLTGVPFKILKKTAFIKDMFSSALEVAKFEGASIRTVSGIRGEIKKSVSKPEGGFRATFEDKILMSDIVFMRTWYPVKPKVFYSPVTSLLLADKEGWKGMRLTSQVRKELEQGIPENPDSKYRKIERQKRRFHTLKVPKRLQSELPFASKPKLQIAKKQERKGYLDSRVEILEPTERKKAALMQQLNIIMKEKERKRKVKQQEQRQVYLKKKEAEDAKEKEKERQYMKKIFQAKSQAEKRKEQSESSRYSKKAKRE
jgi:ribosome biogenesis protein BMS1